jgi:hypothetical protein
MLCHPAVSPKRRQEIHLQPIPPKAWAVLIALIAIVSAYLVCLIPPSYLDDGTKKLIIGALVGGGIALPVPPPGTK